jgi:hypothetical protein
MFGLFGCSNDSSSQSDIIDDLQTTFSEDFGSSVAIVEHKQYPLSSAFYIKNNDNEVNSANLIYSKMEVEKVLTEANYVQLDTNAESLYGPYEGERMISITVERMADVNYNFADPDLTQKEINGHTVYYYDMNQPPVDRLIFYIPFEEIVYGAAFEMGVDENFIDEDAFSYVETLIKSHLKN